MGIYVLEEANCNHNSQQSHRENLSLLGSIQEHSNNDLRLRGRYHRDGKATFDTERREIREHQSDPPEPSRFQPSP